jgi:hypothetical protein
MNKKHFRTNIETSLNHIHGQFLHEMTIHHIFYIRGLLASFSLLTRNMDTTVEDTIDYLQLSDRIEVEFNKYQVSTICDSRR